MRDSTGRIIDYLRISVTDRCNLRCIYCMPAEGVPLRTHSDMLTFDEITAFSKLAVSKGVTKIRITGGEPLVRKNVEILVGMLAAIEGVNDLALTTNGQLLEEKAEVLRLAGLQRVNVSLDTLDAEEYSIITRGGDINRTIRGIRAAQRAGFDPIKINCVVDESQQNQKEILRQFAQKEGLEVRFISRMSLAHGTFSVVEGGSGGDCARCNRLRLTANGLLKPCLFNDIGYDIRTMGYAEALEAALENKPLRGTHNNSGDFYNIGG